MPETRRSLLQHFEQSRAALLASIDGLTTAQMLEPTLDGWSVKDHLAHLAFWDDLRADEVVRLSSGYASVLKMSLEQDHAANMLAFGVRREISLEQSRWELDHSYARLVVALTSATGVALDPAAYGEAGVLSRHGFEHAGYIREWRGRQGF
ncbi:MAG: DinB family protein [Dehalococcoidia bacterium]|nr:DinB family protein [Dehalococcoidia bacterium]MCB9486224.1 DinB family protein [Thermoflexaceae bacterium]